MSKKPELSASLAGILQAKRNGAAAVADPSPALPPVAAPVATPVAVIPAAAKGRLGKCSDPAFSQHSVYLHKTLHKKVRRALEDAETGQDFSELVEELLEQWLAGHS